MPKEDLLTFDLFFGGQKVECTLYIGRIHKNSRIYNNINFYFHFSFRFRFFFFLNGVIFFPTDFFKLNF